MKFAAILVASLLVAANALPQKQTRADKIREEIRNKLSKWIEPVIYGGENAEKGQYPHMIQLQYWGSHMCGASIIGEKWVVTAAHCVSSGGDDITVVAGQHSLSDDDGDEQEVDIKTVHIHPSYGSSGYDYDIAVLELASPLEFNELVQPIALWEDEDTPMEPAEVSGWGDTENGGTPDILKRLDLTIYEKDLCKDAYGDIFTDNMLCATGSLDGGECVCFGDSGSPMYIEQDGTKYQVGIVSWGNPCANAGYPAAYAEVGKFIDFVRDVVPDL